MNRAGFYAYLEELIGDALHVASRTSLTGGAMNELRDETAAKIVETLETHPELLKVLV